jgi:hypothetical protein
MLLVIALIILSGTLIKYADAQSRNVDGTFLVEVRIDTAPAVLLLDTGAEHSLLDRESHGDSDFVQLDLRIFRAPSRRVKLMSCSLPT